VLRKVANAGYPNIEIWADKAHLDPTLSPNILVIKDLLKNLSLQAHSLHAPFSYVNIGALDEECRRCSLSLIKKSIEFCSELEGKIVIVHPHPIGVFFNLKNEAKIIDKTKESLYEIALFAKKEGIKVAVENLPELEGWSFGSDISKLSKLIEEINSNNLGLCLDVGHALVKKKNANLPTDILRCGKYLIALHIQDTDGKRDRHWVPEEGVIDWLQFFKTIEAVSYQGVFTLEVAGSKKKAIDDANDILIKAKEFIKKYLFNV